MGVGEVLGPSASMFGTSFAGFFSKYGWILWLFVGLAVAVVVIVIIKMVSTKKTQWTHRLKIRHVLPSGYCSDETTIKMRRFPLIKRANVFELETALLGNFLINELDGYTGQNEYSIVIDNNGRIYTNRGYFFNPDKSSVNVSARHAGIDLSRDKLRSEYQNINKTSKRVEWAAIAKFAMIGLLIIAVMIISIKGIGAWSDNKDSEAQSNAAFAQAMDNLGEALETSQATVNTQILILEMLKEIKGTNNIQGIVREATNETL